MLPPNRSKTRKGSNLQSPRHQRGLVLTDRRGGDTTSTTTRLLQCGCQPACLPIAERLIRAIKEEEADLSEYQTFGDALAQIGHFIDDVYQKKRIHSALGYLEHLA